MNERSQDLCHWGIEKGGEREGHKYVARVETKPGKYLYFYDLTKYNAWKNGARNKVQDVGNKVRNKAKEVSSKARVAAKDKVNSITNRTRDELKNGNVKLNIAVNKYKKYISKAADEAKTVASDKVNEVKDKAQKKAKELEAKANTKAHEVTNAAKAKMDETANEVKAIAEDVGTKAKNKADDVTKKAEKEAKKVASDVSAEVQKQAGKAKKKIDSEISDFMKTDQGKTVNKVLNDVKNRTESEIQAFINSEKSATARRIMDGINTAVGKKVLDYSKYTKTEEWLPNNLSPEEKVEWYKKNEPSFMNNVPRINPDNNGKYPDLSEDLKYVNPDLQYDSKGNIINPSATVNCWHCSTAFDLRKRGYDVSATATNSHFGSGYSLGTMYDVETTNYSDYGTATESEMRVQKNLLKQYQKELKRTTNDGKKKQLESKIQYLEKAIKEGRNYTMNGVKDNKGSCMSVSPVRAIAAYEDKNRIDTGRYSEEKQNELRGKAIAESVLKSIDSFPNNSWGRIGMNWEGGGGHSISWEKGSDGTIKIVDAQHNTVIDLADYAKDYAMLNSVNIARTDNLQLKEPALWFTKNANPKYENGKKFTDGSNKKT